MTRVPEQPDVQIRLSHGELGGRILINGVDMGAVADVKVHEFVPGQDFAKVTVTLIPSKLTVTTDADSGE